MFGSSPETPRKKRGTIKTTSNQGTTLSDIGNNSRVEKEQSTKIHDLMLTNTRAKPMCCNNVCKIAVKSYACHKLLARICRIALVQVEYIMFVV